MGVEKLHGDETIIAVSEQRRVLLCKASEINYLSGAGKGVLLIRLASGDRLLAFKAVSNEQQALRVKTSLGGEQRISPAKYELSSRGGRGREVMKRGSLTEAVLDAPEPATLES
jgi:DNA gyrase subunit A